jgi:hypothetical protein
MNTLRIATDGYLNSRTKKTLSIASNGYLGGAENKVIPNPGGGGYAAKYDDCRYTNIYNRQKYVSNLKILQSEDDDIFNILKIFIQINKN